MTPGIRSCQWYSKIVNLYHKTIHVPKEFQDTRLKYSFSFAKFILEVCSVFFFLNQVFAKCSLHKLIFHSNISELTTTAISGSY